MASGQNRVSCQSRREVDLTAPPSRVIVSDRQLHGRDRPHLCEPRHVFTAIYSDVHTYVDV
jgi:hypothetical protein